MFAIIATGAIATVRIGRSRRVVRRDLLRWVAEQTAEGDPSIAAGGWPAATVKRSGTRAASGGAKSGTS